MAVVQGPPGKALVTGASSGLGAAIAEALQNDGWEVWTASRRPPARPERWLQVDLAEPSDRERVLSEHADLFASLSLLVNNAGSGVFGRWDQTPPEAIDGQLQLLLHTPLRLCQAVLPGMRSRAEGSIINVSSLAARWPLPCFGAYNAAKAGLSHFSASLRLELRQTGIRVIDFQPGDLRTPWNANCPRHGDDPQLRELWQVLEKNLSGGPTPAAAARCLMAALRRKHDGTLVFGTFFQARLSVIASQVLPARLKSWLLRRYYKLS